jgi:WD40 repeat protein
LWKRPEKLGESSPGQRGFLDKMKRLCFIQPKLPVWRTLSAMPLLTRSHITGARIRCDGPSPMAVSHDGRLIAGSYPIHIWSSRGELETTLPSSSYAGKYAFSRDSKFIVAGELKGLALWHIPTKRKLSTIAIDNYECELWDCHWQVDHVSIFGVSTNGGVFALTLELPSPSNYLSLAAPTNFHETHAKSELKKSQVYLAEQALENQNHALALELLRSIQLQDEFLTDRSLHELEMHICSFGSPVDLVSGALERVFKPVTEKGFFSTNSSGTQLLWIDQVHAKEAKCGWIYHAVLFDATSGKVISEGTLSSDKLELEDANGMWVIGYGNQTTLLIDCENSSTIRCHGWHRLSLTPDGSSLLCRNIHKNQIELIDLKNNQLVSQMPISNYSDSKACISDDAAWAVVLIRECQQEKTTLAQYSCRNWRLIGTLLEDVGGYVSSIALCDCNSKVLISRRKVDSERSELELWDVVQKKYLHSCGRGGELVIAPDCYPYAFVGRHDGTVAVINCTLGKEIFSIPAGGDSVESMTLSHDKLRLIVNGQRIVHLFWSFEFR